MARPRAGVGDSETVGVRGEGDGSCDGSVAQGVVQQVQQELNKIVIVPLKSGDIGLDDNLGARLVKQSRGLAHFLQKRDRLNDPRLQGKRSGIATGQLGVDLSDGSLR